MKRKVATHWVVTTKDRAVVFEKCRPMIRALWPEYSEKEVARVANQIYRADDDGLFHGGMMIVRKSSPELYRKAAKFLRGRAKAQPFLEEADLFRRLAGRICLH